VLQLAFVGGEGVTLGQIDLGGGLSGPSLLQQAGGVAFTLGDNTQQVYVITDPAQLEALQVCTQFQMIWNSVYCEII